MFWREGRHERWGSRLSPVGLNGLGGCPGCVSAASSAGVVPASPFSSQFMRPLAPAH
jgi:hypothetical protein